MAAPGRKPTPTALRIIRGNPSKRPLPESEPVVPASCPEPPKELSAAAKKHWRKVVKQLSSAKVMTDLDAPALALYCECYAKWTDANEKIRQFGPVVKSPNGMPVQSPYLQIANKAFDQMRAMLTEFGMTPSSRARVQSASDSDDPDDPAAKFRGR